MKQHPDRLYFNVFWGNCSLEDWTAAYPIFKKRREGIKLTDSDKLWLLDHCTDQTNLVKGLRADLQ